jgi:DNA-binding NtrC family response regulator
MPKSNEPGATRQTLRVVVVDDDPVLVEVYKIALEKDYQVCGFSQPSKALDHLRGQGADILVTDYTMPELNGIELSREAKALNPGIKIMLISGTFNMVWGTPKVASDEVVDHCMAKPFGVSDLLDHCRRMEC